MERATFILGVRVPTKTLRLDTIYSQKDYTLTLRCSTRDHTDFGLGHVSRWP